MFILVKWDKITTFSNTQSCFMQFRLKDDLILQQSWRKLLSLKSMTLLSSSHRLFSRYEIWFSQIAKYCPFQAFDNFIFWRWLQLSFQCKHSNGQRCDSSVFGCAGKLRKVVISINQRINLVSSIAGGSLGRVEVLSRVWRISLRKNF